MDKLFEAFNRPDAPGAAVMVVENSKAIFAKAYGLAGLEAQIPCRTETNFRLASVTKQFTAMAVLILADRGDLKLDDPLRTFLPEFPDYGNAITIRHLLTHRSGLRNYENLIPRGTTIPLSDRDVLHLLLQQDGTCFPPGAEFRYSNGGYSLLALIIQSLSGETFPAFLRRHIFGPLRMNSTMAYEAGISRVANRAFGYAQTEHGFALCDQSLTSAVLGDGGVYSSVTDLFQWDQALYTEKLVSRAWLREAFAAHSPVSDFPGSGYGCGWYVGMHRGTPWLWHYGSTSGFSTRFERFPEKNFTVMILANRQDAPISGLGRSIADLHW